MSSRPRTAGRLPRTPDHAAGTPPVLVPRTSPEHSGTLSIPRPDGRGDAGCVDVAPPAAVAATAARLRACQPSWEALGVRGRAPHVEALRDWMLDHETPLVDLLVAETGKARPDAVVDLLSALDTVNHYLAHGERYLRDERPRPHSLVARTKRLTVAHRPHPLVGIICPWNFPIGLSLVDALPALIAGCAVIIKPSEATL